MKKIPKVPWKVAEGKTIRLREADMWVDILGKARKFLEYAAYRAEYSHWTKRKTPTF